MNVKSFKKNDAVINRRNLGVLKYAMKKSAEVSKRERRKKSKENEKNIYGKFMQT